MLKQQFTDYNPAEIQWLVDQFFADSPSIYPKPEGIRDLFLLRQLVGKYSVCGRLPNRERWHNLRRYGMIKGLSEHSKYLESLTTGGLGGLAGVTKPQPPIPPPPTADVTSAPPGGLTLSIRGHLPSSASTRPCRLA